MLHMKLESIKKKKIKRFRYTPAQLQILTKTYNITRKPSKDLLDCLANQINAMDNSTFQTKRTSRNIQIWFQNQRASEKRKRLIPKIVANEYISVSCF